jgi:hypothetical protein
VSQIAKLTSYSRRAIWKGLLGLDGIRLLELRVEFDLILYILSQLAARGGFDLQALRIHGMGGDCIFCTPWEQLEQEEEG